MPKWEVKYTTNTEPANLPAGAEVTQLSVYPVTVRRGHGRLDLHPIPPTAGALAGDLVASVKVCGRTIPLTETEARAIAAELVNLADERKAHNEKVAAEKVAADRKARLAKEDRLAAERRAARLRNSLNRYPVALTVADPWPHNVLPPNIFQ